MTKANSTAPTATKKAIVGDAVLTHGTLESRDLAPARQLYEDILGLRCVRHSPQSQLIAGRSGIGIVAVAVAVGHHEQSADNRWVLGVGDERRVRDIHRKATTRKDELGLRVVTPVSDEAGFASFMLHDADGNWWEVTSRSAEEFGAVFKSLEGGQHQRVL